MDNTNFCTLHAMVKQTANCDNQNFIKEVHPSMKTVQKTERNITLYE